MLLMMKERFCVIHITSDVLMILIILLYGRTSKQLIDLSKRKTNYEKVS